jgi:hypothetical protein
MLLVAALVVVAAAMGAAVRRHDGALELTRVADRALLLGVLPAYVVMRAGAEWIVSKEGVGEASWSMAGAKHEAERTRRRLRLADRHPKPQ